MARRLILTTLLLLTGLPLFAQQGPDGDPDAAQGYVDNVFHHSQIDSINLYNGQLTVPVAIGPSYPIGPKLKLQLALTYGARVWEYGRPYVENPNGRSVVLAGDPALGIGWTFTLGAIKSCGYQRTCYFGPDGSEHDFSVSSQFLLQNLGPSGYEMWDGDGNHYVFGWHVSGFDDTLTDYRRDFGRGRDGWYLTSLTDPFGNGYSVTYRTGVGPCWNYSTSCAYQAMQCPTTSMNLWIPDTITLPTTPASTITVAVGTNQMINGFTFPVSGGDSATWTVGYQPTPIPWSERCGGGPALIQPNLEAIQSIQLPNGIGSYQFSYLDPTTCSTGGYLSHLQVPTGATIDYVYGAFAFYHGRLAALNQNCRPIGPDPSAIVEVSAIPPMCVGGPQPVVPMIPPGSCTDEPNYLDRQRAVVRRTETVSGSPSVTNYVQYSFPFGEKGIPTNNCDALGRCGPQSLTVVVFPPDVDGRRRAKGVLFWSGPKRPDQTGVHEGERTGADIEERIYDFNPTQGVDVSTMPVCGSANPICAEHAVRVTQRTYEYDTPTSEIGNRRLRLERTYYSPMLADGTCPDCAFHQVSYSNSGSSSWRGNGGHFNVETHTGNLGNDGLVITTTWSPTVSPWLRTSRQRITTMATGSLNQYFDYDHSAAANGFLRGVLTWDSGRSSSGRMSVYEDVPRRLGHQRKRGFELHSDFCLQRGAGPALLY